MRWGRAGEGEGEEAKEEDDATATDMLCSAAKCVKSSHLFSLSLSHTHTHTHTHTHMYATFITHVSMTIQRRCHGYSIHCYEY